MADIFTLNSLTLALIGGITPTLLWLWFWLHEDMRHPEPRRALFFAFVAGMATVFLVVPFQKISWNFSASITTVFILWAIIEEVFKYAVAWIVALRRGVCNEPVDVVIYMIVVALGFAALENTLFLLEPFGAQGLIDGIAVSNVRFIGATLLHVLSSAIVGVFAAFAYYKSKNHKYIYTFVGLIFAITLHALFNLFIIHSIHSVLIPFGIVWIAAALLIVLFERIKRIKLNEKK